MNNDEDYFENLKCVECHKHYWSDEETKLCKYCLRKITHKDNKDHIDGIMRQKENEIRRPLQEE